MNRPVPTPGVGLVSVSRTCTGHEPARSPLASTNARCAGSLWARYRAVQSGYGARAPRPPCADMSVSSAPEPRISYLDGSGMASTRLVTSDRYGGSGRDVLNGVMSGVTVASVVAAIANVLRQRVR